METSVLLSSDLHSGDIAILLCPLQIRHRLEPGHILLRTASAQLDRAGDLHSLKVYINWQEHENIHPIIFAQSTMHNRRSSCTGGRVCFEYFIRN